MMTGPYDPAQRDAAARLQQAHPWWVVMYGPWSRLYYAFPRFCVPHVPPETFAAATTPGELASLMRVTELEARPGRPRPGGR
jgi:hypothetical protein